MGKTILIALIHFYQGVISPCFLSSCRFYPTCSQYAIEAITRYGAIKGILKTSLRLAKCHPFHPGGYDPV
ncbi:MAG: membrane protein insertion efficiency factor YidD [Desulfomonilia bacterium]